MDPFLSANSAACNADEVASAIYDAGKPGGGGGMGTEEVLEGVNLTIPVPGPRLTK